MVNTRAETAHSVISMRISLLIRNWVIRESTSQALYKVAAFTALTSERCDVELCIFNWPLPPGLNSQNWYGGEFTAQIMQIIREWGLHTVGVN